MSLSADLKATLNNINYSGEGFYKGGEETFYRACEQLMLPGVGMTEEGAVELLTKLYWAVAEEFGC